jgi:hypothetical protein
MAAMTRIWAVVVVALWGCSHTDLPRHPNPVPPAPKKKPAAKVRRVHDRKQLLPGPMATGRRGDFRLENSALAIVVAGLGTPDAGAVLDGVARGGQDSLRRLMPVLGRLQLRAPILDRLELEELGGAATVRLSGADAKIPEIRVTHEYALHPGSAMLRITTTVENRGSEVVLQYRVGDRIEWGQAVPFAPGIGRIPTGTPSLVWLAGWSDGASYAYFHRGGTMGGALSLGQAEVVLETLEVAPGKRASVQRLFAVGPGGQIAHLLPPILQTQDVTGGRLDLSVYSESGEPLPDAVLEIDRDNKPFTVGRTGSDGTASVTLPPGNYRVRAHTSDRTTPSTPAFIRRDQVSARALRSSPPSRLVYEARESRGTTHSVGRFPVKLTVTGVDGTPTPWFGPPSTPRAANTVLCPTGKGVLPLPPGRYKVAVTHGPLHGVHNETVALLPHGGGSLTAQLSAVVEPPGLGVDTGQRTHLSPGTGVTEADRALSNLVEGLDAAVSADPVIKQGAKAPSEQGGVMPITGVTHTSPGLGSVTVFPAPPTADELEGLVEGKTLLRGRVVELTGARRAEGLFSRLELDPDNPSADAIPGTINALRILDGQHPEDFDRLLDDWLALLRAGRMLVATGGSDSRSIYGGEPGYPRTFVNAKKQAGPAGVVRALLAGRAVVSSGPVLRLAVENVAPGGVVKLAPRRRRRRPNKKQAREVSASVSVSAPAWIGLDTLTVYVNGTAWEDPIPIPGQADGERLKQTLKLPISGDSFVVAVVRGTASLAPLVNSPGSPLPPLAVTNPVWIDADGNGRYDPPRRPPRRP